MRARPRLWETTAGLSLPPPTSDHATEPHEVKHGHARCCMCSRQKLAQGCHLSVMRLSGSLPDALRTISSRGVPSSPEAALDPQQTSRVADLLVGEAMSWFDSGRKAVNYPM